MPAGLSCSVTVRAADMPSPRRKPVPSRSYVQPGAPTPAAIQGPEMPLTWPEAVYPGLRRNPAVRSACLQPVLDTFNLRVVESLFSPKGVLMADAIAHLRAKGEAVPDERLGHTPPVGWEHIGLSGDSLWERAASTPVGRRPLNLERQRRAA